MQVDARSRMHVFEQIPGPALRPFIRRFLVVEFSALHRDVHLPDTSPVAAFSFRGGCRIDEGRWVPSAAFTGLRETLRAHKHCDGHAVLWATLHRHRPRRSYICDDRLRLPPDRCRYHEMADWRA